MVEIYLNWLFQDFRTNELLLGVLKNLIRRRWSQALLTMGSSLAPYVIACRRAGNRNSNVQ